MNVFLIWMWLVGYQWISVTLENGRKNELWWIVFRISENVCGQLRYIKNTISKHHASKTIQSVSSWYSCKALVSCQYWHSKWRGISSAILSDVIKSKRGRRITDSQSNFKENMCIFVIKTVFWWESTTFGQQIYLWYFIYSEGAIDVRLK